MNERLSPKLESKLWFDGPNYTADAVVVSPADGKLLLIQRRDTGEWALPGGFIDATDASPCAAAAREVAEEAGVVVGGDAPLIFRGVVDDFRNSESSWIETSAYLFTLPTVARAIANDDAVAARWHSLDALPQLYASHQSIVERGLDHLQSCHLADAAIEPDYVTDVEAGHMEYNKTIRQKDERTVFVKQCDRTRFSDPARASRSYEYLEKEAFTMAHLRQHGFEHVPEHSTLFADSLVMNAYELKRGWQWRADSAIVDTYINQAAEAFAKLQSTAMPADTFTIDQSHTSFLAEGWHAFNDSSVQPLRGRLEQFTPCLTKKSQETSDDLLQNIDELRRIAITPEPTTPSVFCHHDARQSNIAWHPDSGIKLVDWSWAGVGEPGSDMTNLLIDLHKSGHDITAYRNYINPKHCLTLMGFWLEHSTWPAHRNEVVRFQQLLSALSAYEVLRDY